VKTIWLLGIWEPYEGIIQSWMFAGTDEGEALAKASKLAMLAAKPELDPEHEDHWQRVFLESRPLEPEVIDGTKWLNEFIRRDLRNLNRR